MRLLMAWNLLPPDRGRAQWTHWLYRGGVASREPEVFAITEARQSLSQEQQSRTRRYLVSMGIRTACVLGAIFIPGWPRWVLIAGAVVLPYLAVVIANGGRDRHVVQPLPTVRRALPTSQDRADA